MEPLVARSEDYNYHFFRRLIENIKQAKDAQEPEDEETNNVNNHNFCFKFPLEIDEKK
jgi:hypothetical protein